jgi:hypothetical protein
MQSDPMPAFAYYRTQLQYLQWQAGGRTRPWLLKSPTHFGIEPLLESLFGAIVPIITHRDPCRLIPSITSTSEAVRKLYSQRPPGEGLATALTQMFAGAAAMHIAWRDQRTVPALDLAFGEVAKDSDSAIKSVYDFLGMDLTSESLTRIHAWEADESRNRHASITTSASEHGITEDEIRSAFAAYGERFAEYL